MILMAYQFGSIYKSNRPPLTIQAFRRKICWNPQECLVCGPELTTEEHDKVSNLREANLRSLLNQHAARAGKSGQSPPAML